PEVAGKALEAFLPQFSDVSIDLFGPWDALPASAKASLKKFRDFKRITIHDSAPKRKFMPGEPSKFSASRILFDLQLATDFCSHHQAQALVTGPVDKFWCSKVNANFRGHTEFLQERT